VKTQQWKEYQESLPARDQVDQLRVTLESAGGSLTQRQQQQLVAAMTAEKRWQTAEQRRLRDLGSDPRTGSSPLELMVQLTEDSNRRVLDASLAFLSPQQFDALKAQQDQSLGATRAMLRAGRPQTVANQP
jgi:hypothetical protein